MRTSKRPVYLFLSPLFTQCALPNVSFTIPFPAIYPMRFSKCPVSIFRSPLFTQCLPPNISFSYSTASCLPNAPLQTFRLAIAFHAFYSMRPTKRPLDLFLSPLFTQCTTPFITFRYSIPRYLRNASPKRPV